jgi:hypothetical protein
MPPPPAIYLAPPAFLESPQDNEERQRQQKLIDESRKKKEDKFEEYRPRPLRQRLPEEYRSTLLLPSGIHPHRPRASRPERLAPNVQRNDALSPHEGEIAKQARPKLPEGRRRDQEEARRITRRPQGMSRIPRSPRLNRRSLVQDTSPRYCQQPCYAASPGQTASTSTTSHSKFGSIHRILSQRRGRPTSMGDTPSQC